MRDILPEQMIKRQFVIDLMREVFEEFGFEPLQTPAIELSETLTGKYGEDAERLIYKAWYGDTPGAEVSLRYDLSVPLSRVAAMYPDLPRPFKRYQIAPVWRADRPQKGRYREFYQCDVDIVGATSMLADAEIVAMIYQVLNRLGFEAFTISINNRKILDGIGDYAGVPESLQPGLYRSIDKLDKIGLDGVRQELLTVGLPKEPREPLQRAARLVLQGKLGDDGLEEYLTTSQADGGEGLDARMVEGVLSSFKGLIADTAAQDSPSGQLQAATAQIVNELSDSLRTYYGSSVEIIPESVVDRLLDLLQIQGPPMQVLEKLESRLQGFSRATDGIQEMRDLFRYLKALNVPETAYALNFAMVRGLEYYTGPIFETTIEKPKAMPSITGGGRFDELIGLFSDVSYPATGTSLGIERIIDAMEELDMFPVSIRSATAEALVTIFSPETVENSLMIASQLRMDGISTSTTFDPDSSLRDQIGYASSKGIPYVIILGPEEIAQGNVTIRKLGATASESEQRTIPREQAAAEIRNW
jgi:histidyl-tRNA synthetase